MAAQNQTITVDTLPAKTYGDAPFTVTASSSVGLPITKWESTDPSVASVSSAGLVTLVGAGQTSIIASNTGDSKFNSAWSARPLMVSRSLAPLPTGTLSVTYDGGSQGLNPSTLPSGLATEITYRDTRVAEAPAVPQVVFQNNPDTLELSYYSKGLQAAGYWGMAKYVGLGGTARKLHSCDVTLVSWAGYYGGKNNDPNYRYKEWADAHPDLAVVPNPDVSVPGDSGGYYHPVTLSFYEYVNDGVIETYRILTSQTVRAFIPWRPSTDVDGVLPYPYFGNAFRVSFNFADGIILPSNVWVAVSFNTSTYGTTPVGSAGPYDALNVPNPSSDQAGSTLLSSTLLYKDWRWQSSSGTTGPMLRLRTVTTSATTAAPVNAATYEVKTKAAAFETDAVSTSMLVINKAPLAINLTNLIQVRDGAPKPVLVSTVPSGVSTAVTYSGSSAAPSALGTYPVSATSANPNYEGQANGILRIGDSFASWQSANFGGSGLAPEQTSATADPDGDGLSNLLEYASNLNPLAGDNPSPVGFEYGTSTLAFTYRRNLNALDLDYAIQDTTNLTDALSWKGVTPLSETVLSDDGSTKVIRATIAKPVGQPLYFMRLKTAK